MNVYIDLPNLRSYAKQGGHQSFRACTDMLRQNFNLCFTFKKEIIQREKKNSLASIMNLMRQLTSNRGNSDVFKWDTMFPERPLKEDGYDTMSKDQLMSIYLLDDPNIDTVAKHGCLLFGAEGSEMKVLENLLIDGQLRATKKYNQRSMTDWSTIANNASPCTDIIIVDPYLFAQSDLLYEYNSYKVIENLARWNSGYPLDIVIFTFSQHKDGTSWVSVPFPTIERQLKARLKEQTGTDHNITFVILPEGKEHDRYIITNYKMFDSGDSFKYFNDKGENISNGRWFHVNTHGDKENREQTLAAIADLQAIIEEVKSGLNSIRGDKKSRFLTFD